VIAACLPRLGPMTDECQTSEGAVVDEGSWIYLIASPTDRNAADSLHDRVVETCEAGGWPAVSWPPAGGDRPSDPGHLFEGVRHAVEHADCVVALLGGVAGTTDAELALAYSHRRPIVAMRRNDDSLPTSEVQAMLATYERARMIVCDDADQCATELRGVLDDPEFAATIRRAAGEHSGGG
jgi:nucleoside 2-deoxyribosyltransferase